MAVAERTYSFRASSSLGERIKSVQQTLAGLSSGQGGDLPDKLMRELVLQLLRRPDLQELKNNQSAFMRTTIEVLVAAAEKIEEDAHFTRLYAEERADKAGIAERRDGAKLAVARRWQDL